MGFKRESLENLRQKIDLLEVLQPYVEIKRAGAVWKGLCPFHDEKTPSFVIHREDQHYHCYGCGAHGDAIEFLMQMQKLSFGDAVRVLAEKFHVPLEEERESKGPSSKLLKEALQHAADFFHTYLFHTIEGEQARQYLEKRKIGEPFLQKFQIGLAPRRRDVFLAMMREEGIAEEILVATGLALQRRDGELIPFFSDRILFPIQNALGAVIGFSGRKFREETEGGKYVNSPETPLFKKSKVLFGLCFSRKRIAKESRAILVEGQIDALRLIDGGLNLVVAAQGTAFGKEHADELLALGVEELFLAMDSDAAGQEATRKAGDLLQSRGVSVRVAALPEGCDPDLLVREKGIGAFMELLEQAEEYVSFLLRRLSAGRDLRVPAVKNRLVDVVVEQIRSWNKPVLVHESLKKAARILQVPEEMVGVGQDPIRRTYVRKMGSLEGGMAIHPVQILEEDFVRWLLVAGRELPHLMALAQAHLPPSSLQTPFCAALYEALCRYAEAGKPWELLQLAASLEDEEAMEKLERLLSKKVKRERAEALLADTVQKLLHHQWMVRKEEIRAQIQSGRCSEEEAMGLAKEFSAIQKNPPQILSQVALMEGKSGKKASRVF